MFLVSALPIGGLCFVVGEVSTVIFPVNSSPPGSCSWAVYLSLCIYHLPSLACFIKRGLLAALHVSCGGESWWVIRPLCWPVYLIFFGSLVTSGLPWWCIPFGSLYRDEVSGASFPT